ncbi:LysR family transcriptional regulator [Parashewanella tropica]|uniref:LysR family transcriptional regulator n=1 Tax=Parashewanella tropica TaxID=2547970 RepID=UPI00105A70E1|nr:LysR family transcriptional regulator [Parashewanella tropica]
MKQFRYMSVFAHVVDKGSISAAAEALDLSKSVISHQLKLLETELDVVLLKRTTRSQSLTPAGEAFYRHCKQLNELAENAWLQAKETQSIPKGKVKITAPNALMDTIVVPAITQLMQTYPELQPELISNDRLLNLSKEDIDLAIRVGPSPNSGMKQRRIGQFRDVLCGHPCFMNDGAGVDNAYIANSWQGAHIYHQFKHHKTKDELEFTAKAKCVANSFHTCLSLLNNKVGIGVVPDFLFKQMRPKLVEIYPEYQLPINKVYAVYPFMDNLPLNVRVCLEGIEGELVAKGSC